MLVFNVLLYKSLELREGHVEVNHRLKALLVLILFIMGTTASIEFINVKRREQLNVKLIEAIKKNNKTEVARLLELGAVASSEKEHLPEFNDILIGIFKRAHRKYFAKEKYDPLGICLKETGVTSSYPYRFTYNPENTQIISDLLKYGANANAGNRDRDSYLFLAIGTGKDKTAILLLLNGADPNCVSSVTKTSALMLAVRSQNTELVQMLLSKGADKRYKSPNGETAKIAADQCKANNHIRELLQ